MAACGADSTSERPSNSAGERRFWPITAYQRPGEGEPLLPLESLWCLIGPVVRPRVTRFFATSCHLAVTAHGCVGLQLRQMSQQFCHHPDNTERKDHEEHRERR